MIKTPKIPDLISEDEDLKIICDSQAKEIESLKQKVQLYEEYLRLNNSKLYGSSSENSSALDLVFNEAERLANKDIPEPVIEEITYKRKKQKGKRELDLSDLPTAVIHNELSEAERICPIHKTVMHEIGTEVHSVVERIPAKTAVTKYITHIYGCRLCDADGTEATILRAPAPELPIKNSIASPSLLASIATDKYQKALPLYRQEQSFKLEGIGFINRQNMANWMIKISSDWLSTIYDAMHKQLVKDEVLHADETTVQILHEDKKKAQSKSYMWLYCTAASAKYPIVLYEYQRSRSYEHPKKFLAGFNGYLMCDGYNGYHKLKNLTAVGCWAHCRRYFTDALKATPKEEQADSLAKVGVEYCNRLFELERQFVDMSAKERHAARLEHSKPVADEFYGWVKNCGATPKSLIGRAVGYTVAQWQYLSNVFLDGRLELSNNRAERAVKPFVIGRKNWLFSNTKSGANASAVIYSIIETAKANHLVPFEYFKYLLEQLPNITTSQLPGVMPWSDTLPDYCKLPADPAKKPAI
jgi:transposase